MNCSPDRWFHISELRRKVCCALAQDDECWYYFLTAMRYRGDNNNRAMVAAENLWELSDCLSFSHGIEVEDAKYL